MNIIMCRKHESYRDACTGNKKLGETRINATGHQALAGHGEKPTLFHQISLMTAQRLIVFCILSRRESSG